MQPGFATAEGYHATPLISHGGNTLTMTSNSLVWPELDVAISILANGDEEDVTDVVLAALHAAAADRMPSPSAVPEFPPPLEDGSGYTGAFTEPNLGDVTLTWQDGDLQIEVPLLDAIDIPYEHTLTPLELDSFAWNADGEDEFINFYPGVDGRDYVYAVGTDDIAFTRVPPRVQ